MKYLESPIKSPADVKSYRALELANGLKVLLISKPTNEGEQIASAVSMVVEGLKISVWYKKKFQKKYCENF